MPKMIDPCNPPVMYYDYSHPESQGALMVETRGWPQDYKHEYGLDRHGDGYDEYHLMRPMIQKPVPTPVPKGLDIFGFWTDHVPREAAEKAWAELPQGGFRCAQDEHLVAFVEALYPEHEIREVRVVHHYNTATLFSTFLVNFLFDIG